MAWTIVLQQVVLTDIPLPFSFPWSLLLNTFVAAVISALASSYGPIAALLRKPIVEVLRSGD
jgi:ABC-type antimicrobial peptide transport system permease subunit